MAIVHELSKEERAYRRGALQAIQWLIASLGGQEPSLEFLARWEQALVAGRTSLKARYLGTYLDEITSDLSCGMETYREFRTTEKSHEP